MHNNDLKENNHIIRNQSIDSQEDDSFWNDTPLDEEPSFEAKHNELHLFSEEEEKKKIQPFWFVSYVGFEEYESKRNRLIMNLRRWSLSSPETVTVYINHPITISTSPFYDYDSLYTYLEKLNKSMDKTYKITCYLSYADRDKKTELEKKFPDFEFVIDNIKSSVVNATVPCEKRTLDNFEKLGFQTKNINKSIRRQLGWMYKKVKISSELEYIFSKIKELNELDSILIEKISKFYGKDSKHYDKILVAKITRAVNDFRHFYLEGNKISDFLTENSGILRGKHPIVYRIFNSNESFARELEEIGIKFGSLRFSLDLAAKSLNNQNSVIYNWDNEQYELVLQPKSELNPYVKGGTEPEGMLLTDERIPYVCWKSLSTCFIDIEKPMWKTEEERKIMQEISELQAELANKNSTRDPSEINEKIQELSKKMVMKTNQSGDVNLLEDRYKEQISRVMIHLRKEDGSMKRFYFKLRNTAINDEIKEINGFTVLYFDTEYELLNAVIKFIKQEKPYRIVGHVIPYDLSELRDSARKNKTERFEIAVKKKEPRLWRRDFYQKISLAAQEILDTHRLASVWFPYLKMKPFDLSHKLADVANFIYLQKKRMCIKTVMDTEFHKIATHNELKELEIMAINGNKDAEYKLDFYSTHDIDPLIEIFDFEPTLKLLYKAAAMAPHVPITDVAFSPTSMNEIFHLREWKVRHTQLHYGYKQKKREDERQIFKKRLNEYMKRQLMDEGIPQIKPGLYYDAYMTYIPLELMLSSTFFPSQPEWSSYFKSLHYDPIIKIAELQYPKYFMRQNIHVDYYLYRREMDIYREILRLLNISKDEATNLMQKYYVAVAKADGTAIGTRSKKEFVKQSLVRQYYATYETVKDKFRSFYISLKTKDKKASRKIKNHIRKGSTRREDNQLTFNFVNFFEKENSDIIKLYNLPSDLESTLEESSKEKLDRFKSQFERLMKINDKIVSILAKSEYSDITDRISAENMVFLFNQYMRAMHYKDMFNAVYQINPEGKFSFRTLIDNAYKTIGEWIKGKNLYVIGAKGDYLFIKDKDGKDIDFTDSPLIPIRKFDKLDLIGDEEDTDTFLEELENYD
ncbi:MAG: hypothetical protein QXO35_03295 [Candidatus Micrarchaeia archaeon]